MNTVFTKLKDFVGFNEPEEYDYEYDEEMEGNEYPQNLYPQENPQAVAEEDRQNRRRSRERSPLSSEAVRGVAARNNVIGMPGTNNGVFEVVVIEPRSFEKMPQVIQALKERKSVILNLTMMDPDEAQRAVDFVAGGTYAMDGHQERVGDSIFLFTPNCVQVTTQSGMGHEVGSAPTQRDPMRPVAPAPAWITQTDPLAQAQ